MIISQEEIKHNRDILKCFYGEKKHLDDLHKAIMLMAGNNKLLYYELFGFITTNIDTKYSLMSLFFPNNRTLDKEKHPEKYLINKITNLYNNYIKENELNGIPKDIIIPDSKEVKSIVLKPLGKQQNNDKSTHLSTSVPVNENNNNMNNTQPENNKSYEFVNHPSHYNEWSYEVIDMMEKIYGTEQTAMWCEITAFKYAMRMGFKPTDSIQQDIDKRNWYLNKAKELKNKINK